MSLNRGMIAEDAKTERSQPPAAKALLWRKPEELLALLVRFNSTAKALLRHPSEEQLALLDRFNSTAKALQLLPSEEQLALLDIFNSALGAPADRAAVERAAVERGGARVEAVPGYVDTSIDIADAKALSQTKTLMTSDGRKKKKRTRRHKKRRGKKTRSYKRRRH